MKTKIMKINEINKFFLKKSYTMILLKIALIIIIFFIDIKISEKSD